MNNLKKLKELVDEGTELDGTKTPREVEALPTGSFNYHKPITVYDVDKEQYRKWDEKVINFLNANHLQQFIEAKGACNDFQEEHKGNCINFTPQYEKLKNLYNLSTVLNNKKLIVPTNPKKIKRDFLIIASHKDTQLLDTYYEFIGRDCFLEVYNSLGDFLNFTIHFGSGISYSLHGSEFLTLKGKEELKKIKTWWTGINWKKWIGVIFSLLIGSGLAFNYIIKSQKQNAAVNVSGSNNIIVLEQNQDND